MKQEGKVVEVFSANKAHKDKTRPKVAVLKMIKGYGIEHDKFAGKDEARAVMLIGLSAYALANKHGISLEYGSLGENILVDFDPHQFYVGDVFCIGEVMLEVTQSCTICKHLSHFDRRLPKLLANDRGLYCKIVQAGKVYKKERVFVKELHENVSSAS